MLAHSRSGAGRNRTAQRADRRWQRQRARAVDVQINRLRRKIEREPGQSPYSCRRLRGIGYRLVASP